MVNSKFFNSEKSSKRTFLTALFLVFASIISCCVFSGITQAYYKKDHNVGCYAIAYTQKQKLKGNNFYTSSTFATNQVCATLNEDGTVNGDLRQQEVPSGFNSIESMAVTKNHPTLEVDGSKTVNIDYCSTLPSSVCTKVERQSFEYNGESFLDFVKSIQTFMEQKTETKDGFSLQGISDNVTKDTAQKQAQEESQKEIEEQKSECEHVLSLGWIICPIIQDLRNAVVGMYDGVVEPFLNFNTEILASDGSNDGGVFAAWQIFQNFANIAMIIIILVIIFSQLTGVGIDNYGIKKMLPRLIISIVLINLSYIICQLAVDISNILGFSLRALFENLIDVNSLSTTDASGVMGTIAAEGAIAASVGIMFSVGWEGLVLMIPAILGGLVAGVVAIIFIFILLGVRQAGVILFVAIAPVAFVLYILPNTKKLFDKWVKIFEALLLVYPICGTLMGASFFASTLLLNANPDGGFWYGLVAMLIQVVPFFFIPTILKNSFAALGNLGNKISGFGSRLGGRARRLSSGAVNNSLRYRDAVNAANLSRSNRYNRGIVSRLGERSDLTDAQSRRLAIAQNSLAKQDSDAVAFRRDAIMRSGEGYKKASDLRGKLEEAIANGNETDIRAYQDILLDKGHEGREEARSAMENALKNGKYSEKSIRAYSRNITDNHKDLKGLARSSFDFAVNNGGYDASSGKNPIGFKDTAGHLDDLSDEKLAKMDKEELQRYVKNVGNMSSGDRTRLGKIAQSALSNERIYQTMGEAQKAALGSLAKFAQPQYESPITPPAPTGSSNESGGTGNMTESSGRFNIQHGPTLAGGSTTVSAPAPTSIQERRSVVNENPTVEERTVVDGRRNTRIVEQNQTQGSASAGQLDAAAIQEAVRKGIARGIADNARPSSPTPTLLNEFGKPMSSNPPEGTKKK